MIALAAVTRGDIANYVQALFLVYILLIFVYILLNMMFSLGLRPPLLALHRRGHELPARRSRART